MSALFACAARRARAPGAACTAARPRGQPRAGGSPPPTPGARPRRGSPGATPVRPAGLDLREDALAELVPGTREREGDVRVEALEAAAPAGASDAVLERGAAVAADRAAGERPAQFPLLLVPRRETRCEGGLPARRLAPALDPSGRFEPRHGGDEMPAGEVVRRGERLAVRGVGALLGDGRSAEGTAQGDTAKRARLASELPRYNRSISVGDHGGQHDVLHAARAATAGCP